MATAGAHLEELRLLADGKLDIAVSNGVTNPVVNGVVTTHPGVLLQSATSPGTFGALQDLP